MGTTSSTTMQQNEEISKFIADEVSTNDVVIWSKTYCGYCARTKAVFQNPDFAGLKVAVHELDRHPQGDAIQTTLAQQTGQRTVPNVWIKGKFIGGNDDTHHALRTGQLHSKLGISKM